MGFYHLFLTHMSSSLDQAFYQEIAKFKSSNPNARTDELENYIQSMIESKGIEERGVRIQSEESHACPTDPFLRVMCEWCQ